jgi:hypothetical protein
VTGSAVILPPSFSHRSSIFFFSRFLSVLSGIVVYLTFFTIVTILSRYALLVILDAASSSRQEITPASHP